ncbi:acetyl-CoA hydrolase/transferase family protein [Alicyclobacillus sp. ALC3]|nr:acetyl-CoA hydrolase/transferase family protein [Alicyclobacillus sp. ALC3]
MKMVQLSEAMSHIQSRMRIYTQGMASTPHYLLAGLAERAKSLDGVTMYHLHLEGPTPWVTSELRPHIKDISLFVGKNLRDAVRTGLSDYVPIFLSEVPWFLQQPKFRPHVVLINVSPPDRHGFVSLGPTIEATLAAVHNADIVIAQVNPYVPRTLGDALLSVHDITYGVEYAESLNASEVGSSDQISREIGRYVADLIPDRATLQLGIGRIPDAVLTELTDHKDLGVHSEMISDGVRALTEQGVITGRYKTTDPGQIVATFCMGSHALYEFINDNPAVSIRAVDYTNNTAVIRQNPRMMSVNSAVEVDLTGQVVAESVGPRILSGVGGQMDFVRGASLSVEGKSIIALPSRTNSGRPRIVANLQEGAGVTTTRNHVQFVVTEYGVAALHGQTLRERARQLIAVAHPDDRASLEEQVGKRLPRL